jgi:hypothetical protein
MNIEINAFLAKAESMKMQEEELQIALQNIRD